MPDSTLTQKEAHDIFRRSDYFYCKREKCSMRKTLCVLYQKQALGSVERFKCMNCPQGKLIKAELIEKEKVHNGQRTHDR